MNAPFPTPLASVREARLSDAAERAAITAYVADHPVGTPFHLVEWSTAIAAATRNAAHVLIAEHDSGRIAGLLPLTAVRSPLFGRALVSTGFGVDGGILAHDAATTRALADAAWWLAARTRSPGVELRGGATPGPEWTTDTSSYLGFVRDLAGDDEAELVAIPRKQRAEVRRSFGNDLEIVTGTSKRDLAEHYAVYAESVHNLGTPVFPRALFREVIAAGLGEILTVRHAGKPVASVLSLYWNGTIYPYWGGGTTQARALRANDAMYFALMRHARSLGATRFDFGRSKTGTGAAAFKKNWGFEPRPLAYHRRTAAGAAAREVNPLDPRYARKIEAWKRLPLPVANLIGPFISRGLG